MDSILSTTSAIGVTKCTTISDNFPSILSIYYQLTKFDWPFNGATRERTNALLTLFGVSGIGTPNINSTVLVKKADNDEPFLRVIVNDVVDMCCNLNDLIPQFSNNFYQMIAFVLNSKTSLVLKSYGVFFVINVWYRVNQLQPIHLALGQTVLILLSTTGRMNTAVSEIFEEKGCLLQDTDTTSYVNLYNFPSFKENPYDFVRAYAGLKRKKKVPISLTNNYINKVLNFESKSLEHKDYAILSQYYVTIDMSAQKFVKTKMLKPCTVEKKEKTKSARKSKRPIKMISTPTLISPPKRFR